MPSSLTVLLVSLLLGIPAVLFCLWLLILPARVSCLCPKECQCDPGGYFVACSDISLNPVPLIHLTDVRVLWLNENEITFLKNNSFFSLSVLDVLILRKCGLRTIEMGAFKGLTRLTVLSIEGNQFSEIIPGTFENLKSLEVFGLRNNTLEHVDSDMFRGMVNLREMDLSFNKLQYLHPDTFLGLPNLQHLYIFGNWYLQIPTERNFINSHSLSYPDISHCNVSSLSVETFAKVSVLEWLDLRYNRLRSVDINILRTLPKLSEIYLYSNRLYCDCQLQEMWCWCQDVVIF